MGEDASTVTSPSPRQLREACATTRARITAHVDEVEARLRERVEVVAGTNRLIGPGMTAILVGAAVGYLAIRPWTSRRS